MFEHHKDKAKTTGEKWEIFAECAREIVAKVKGVPLAPEGVQYYQKYELQDILFPQKNGKKRFQKKEHAE